MRWWRNLFLKTTAAGRALGLAREHLDIADRHARVRDSWESHLQNSRRVILEAVGRVADRRRALVIGAGDCLDVPVAELAQEFGKVVLADIVIGREARRLARGSGGRIESHAWDATGALATLAAERESADAARAAAILAQADAGAPPGGEADLVISANCISQLGLVPGHSLPAMARDKSLPDRCAKAAARRHLDWLAARSGIRLLIADVARIDVGPDGRELQRETLPWRHELKRAPDRSWRWDLAPIPEWSEKFHRVHEVGAWIDA